MLREMTKTTWRATLTLLLVLSAVLSADAQSLSMDYLRYIEQWSPLAVRHQQQYGIPASITLSQGLLESCAGLSRLATEGNNHFGIKCHKDWTGDGIYADDDEKNECFRKYADASESFEDHARFLKRKRYQPLFQLKETDYAGWAAGLKQCGYATDPSYAAKLVNIIETYVLYKYDTGQPVVAQRRELRGDETMEHTIDMAIVNEFKIMHKIRQKWGLYYVTVYPGDTYDSIAEEFGMKKRKLLDFNDLDRNSEMLHSGAMLYLQEKNERMPDGMPEAHKVKRGETASSIARDYGLKLKSLLHINNLRENDTLTVGTYLRLR